MGRHQQRQRAVAEAATESSGSKWQLTARREAAITAAAVALNHDFWRVNNLLAASPWAGNFSPSPSPSPSRARLASYLNLVARGGVWGSLEACSKNKVISGATCRWHAMQLLLWLSPAVGQFFWPSCCSGSTRSM